METEYFVRLGNWGDVICCDAEWDASMAAQPIERGQRVICRTVRGLELGTVTTSLAADSWSDSSISAPVVATARILRRTTVEDELWIARLEKERLQAVEECRQQLSAEGSSAVLLDVDQLFDSATLIFYFLEPVDDRVSDLVNSLAQRLKVECAHSISRNLSNKVVAADAGPVTPRVQRSEATVVARHALSVSWRGVSAIGCPACEIV